MKTSILVVEDNKVFQEVLVDAISDDRGITVEAADSIAAARAMMAASGGFDLMVLDVKLPDGDGRDFCADLRQKGIDTPVIFLTGLPDEDDVVHGFAAGADDYLTKPVNLRELVARITAQLRYRAPREQQH